MTRTFIIYDGTNIRKILNFCIGEEVCILVRGINDFPIIKVRGIEFQVGDIIEKVEEDNLTIYKKGEMNG